MTTTTATMTTSVRLEPIQVHVGELLQAGMMQRPTLVLNRHNLTTECVLGRNTTTGIEDRWVHRHAATVLLAPNGNVWLFYPPVEPVGDQQPARLRRHSNNNNNNNNKPAASSLLVNGQPPRPDSRQRQRDIPATLNSDHYHPQQPRHAMALHHGDIITIEGRRDPLPLQYSYQVSFLTTTTEAGAAATSTVAVATTVATSSPNRKIAAITKPPPVASPLLLPPVPSEPSLLEPIGNEAMCAICMEIQVRSRSLVPCGHSFCQTCLVTTGTRRLPTSCPVCRMQPVQSHVPNLALDNMIWNMIVAQSTMSMLSSSSSFFDPEDIPTYLERSGKKLLVATTSVATAAVATAAAAAAVPVAAAAALPQYGLGARPGRHENQAPPIAAAAANTTVPLRLRRRRPPPQIQPSHPLVQSPSPSARRKRRRVAIIQQHPNTNHNEALNLGTSLANAICLD